MQRNELLEGSNSYLVVIINSFVRDVQIAPDEYIEATSKDEGVRSTDYEWFDFDDGELAIGVYKGYSLDEVLDEASIVWNIDKRALKGYELK